MINYNFLQRSLHNIFLSNFFKRTLYDLEKLIFLKSCGDIKLNEHVFITGLPRSGTTATLNFLYNTNDFVSLTYRNMPLLMAPNLNSFLNSKIQIKKYPGITMTEFILILIAQKLWMKYLFQHLKIIPN